MLWVCVCVSLCLRIFTISLARSAKTNIFRRKSIFIRLVFEEQRPRHCNRCFPPPPTQRPFLCRKCSPIVFAAMHIGKALQNHEVTTITYERETFSLLLPVFNYSFQSTEIPQIVFLFSFILLRFIRHRRRRRRRPYLHRLAEMLQAKKK